MSCCTTPLVGDTYDEDTIGILEAAHRLALEQILLLVREEIVLRGAFVIPFPGPGEIPFALALLCALTAFGRERCSRSEVTRLAGSTSPLSCSRWAGSSI